MCKDHIINFVDLIDFFTKSRVLMIKEKIWNYYKHIEETEPMKIVTLNNIIEYLSNDLNPVYIFILQHNLFYFFLLFYFNCRINN